MLNKISTEHTLSHRPACRAMANSHLEKLLNPSAIALIGATEKPASVGRTILENLRSGGFHGPIYPVNPSRAEVLGLRAYSSISKVPEKVDLAIIVTPAATVPDLVAECSAAGVSGAVVISAGFKECGEPGRELERQIQARRGQMRVIGPNCLGVMLPHLNLNATFAATMAQRGSVGFISQSGALCTAILDWSLREHVGFSAFFSVGSMLDVGWGDLIRHLGSDPLTRSIVIYMESIGDARAFLSAAREVALTKPIIVIKVGRSDEAARAAASHTGALTGSDEVLDAAFQRAGVLRVNSMAELFNTAEILGKQPRPAGPRLAILTNGGGPGALTTDMLMAEGGALASLSSESLTAFNKMLPPHWSHHNPVDILGDASAERYARAVEVLAQDPNNDGILVILTPQAMTESTATAEKLAAVSHVSAKPLLTSWMGGESMDQGVRILNEANIPTFAYPDTAAKAFCAMWRYSDSLRSLYETPSHRAGFEHGDTRHGAVEDIINTALERGRTLLTEEESKRILAAYKIPVPEMHIAHSPEQAVRFAHRLGYPVVLKLHSRTITHKTDVGGVKLDLPDAAAVASAFYQIRDSVKDRVGEGHFHGVAVQPMIRHRGSELILGCSVDPQFGPVLLFGAGGQLVEVWKDRALGLPPLNANLARKMMERTRIYTALKGVRGEQPVDLTALEKLLVRFSILVTEHPRIKEMDINPLIASASGIQALDARVVLHDPELSSDQLPKPAIRPYPADYVSTLKVHGQNIVLRPITPEDEPSMVSFHRTLSDESVGFRYFTALNLDQRVKHERLSRICFNDYDREIALVAELRHRDAGTREILGVARLIKGNDTDTAEFAVIISDTWQGRGLGTQMLRRLAEVARMEKVELLEGYILPENGAMRHVCEKAGFKMSFDSNERFWIARLDFEQGQND